MCLHMALVTVDIKNENKHKTDTHKAFIGEMIVKFSSLLL